MTSFSACFTRKAYAAPVNGSRASAAWATRAFSELLVKMRQSSNTNSVLSDNVNACLHK